MAAHDRDLVLLRLVIRELPSLLLSIMRDSVASALIWMASVVADDPPAPFLLTARTTRASGDSKRCLIFFRFG